MILCGFGSFCVHHFEGIYVVFSVLDVKEHKLVLDSSFGSYEFACARSKLKRA